MLNSHRIKKCSSRCTTGEQRGVCDNVVQIRYKQWGDKEMMLAWQEGSRSFNLGNFLGGGDSSFKSSESCISDGKQVF